MVCDGKKMPIDIDAPPQFRAGLQEQIVDEVLNKKIQDLRDVIKIQCQDGNWNYDDYMFGMANGLLVAQSILEDIHDPQFLEAPERWKKDMNIVNQIMKEAGYKVAQDKGKKFECIKEGVIEIIVGASARSAEVRKGDVFVVTAKHRLGYEGGLVTKSLWSHQPGLSGQKTDPAPRDYKFICLLRNDNINGNDDFFAQFKEI